MTDPNRSYAKFLKKQAEEYSDYSEHPHIGTLEAMNDLKLLGVPTFFLSILDLQDEIYFHLSDVLKTHRRDGEILEDPGCYIYEKPNPLLKFLPEVNKLGNQVSIKISKQHYKFADINLSRYYNTLRKQNIQIKHRLMQADRISSSGRIALSQELQSDYVRFIQRIAGLKKVSDEYFHLKSERKFFHQKLENLERKIFKAIRDKGIKIPH